MKHIVHRTVIAASLVLSACGGGATSERAEPSTERSSNNTSGSASAGGDASAPPTQATLGGSGATLEDPIEVCGAGESYQRIADFVCPGGDVPLRGIPDLGAAARLGSTSPHMPGASMMESHIVDLYEVPCARGPVEVFVCLYHCGPGASPFD